KKIGFDPDFVLLSQAAPTPAGSRMTGPSHGRPRRLVHILDEQGADGVRLHSTGVSHPARGGRRGSVAIPREVRSRRSWLRSNSSHFGLLVENDDGISTPLLRLFDHLFYRGAALAKVTGSPGAVIRFRLSDHAVLAWRSTAVLPHVH